MREREGWTVAKEMSRLLLIALIVSAGIGVLAPLTVTTEARASVLAEKKDEKPKKDQKNRKSQDDDRDDDFVLNGQVLAIDDVRIGDYVELTGEKINELLFETTQISVGQRFDGPAPDSAEAEPGDESGHDDADEDGE